jgi:hypothetical protein
MSHQSPRLSESWRRLAASFGLQVIAPAEITLNSGQTIVVDVLLLHFGGAKGMALVAKEDSIRASMSDLLTAGYGYSVLEEPDGSALPTAEELSNILNDWGWTGTEHDARPALLTRIGH